jgi:hypothetical protein
MKKFKLLSYLLFAAALILTAGTTLLAQPYDINDALKDLQDISVAINNVIGPNLSGMSYIGDPVGYSFIPHAELGVSAGTVFVPLQSITEGTNMEIDFGDLEKFAFLPLPAVGAHAKFSFLEKFELGFKLAGIPTISNKEYGMSLRNLILGGKARYNLLHFERRVLRGGLSVGGYYEYTKGDIALSATQTINIDVDGNGTTDGQFLSDAGFDTSWRASSFGGEVQGNIQVLFLNLFAGSRIGTTIGRSTTTLNGTGVLVDAGGGLIDDSLPPQQVTVTEEHRTSGVDPFLFGGAELKFLGIVLSGKGTYNFTNDSFMVDAGLRFQF